MQINNFVQYCQSFPLKSEKKFFPILPQKSFNQDEDKDIKDSYYNSRLHELEGNIRILEKKYKQNIKEGFENKIKSFRIQAVMQRKLIQSTIEETKKQIEQAQYEEKTKRAKSQKEVQANVLHSVEERLKDRRKRARSKIEKERQYIKAKIKEKQFELHAQNKQAHDKIIESLQFTDLKKKYLQSLRKKQYSREVEREKTLYIQKIIENKETLDKLQKQLAEISNNSKILIQDAKYQQTFLTI